MSKYVLRLGAIVLAGCILSTARADLVAHFTFDNASNLGENTGSATTEWSSFVGATQTAGRFGNAVALTPATLNIWDGDFGADTGLNFSSFSVSMHVKGGIDDWTDYFALGTVANQFRIEQTGAGSAAIYYTGTPGGSTAQIVGSTNVIDGNWHHLGMVSDGSTLSLYIDGSRQGSAVAYAGSGTVTSIQLGNQLGGGRASPATIDDVGIWNVALTSDQMAQLATNAIPEPATFGIVLATLGAAVLRRRRFG